MGTPVALPAHMVGTRSARGAAQQTIALHFVLMGHLFVKAKSTIISGYKITASLLDHGINEDIW